MNWEIDYVFNTKQELTIWWYFELEHGVGTVIYTNPKRKKSRLIRIISQYLWS